MAAPTIQQLAARLIDLFGPQAAADPTKLYGNLMVSPSGNILIGTTADDGTHKLQVNGTGIITGGLRISGGSGLVFPDGSQQYSGTPMRNRIINGRGFVAQRNTSAAAVSSGYGYGGPDRFLNGTGGQGAFTVSQGTMTVAGISYPCITQTVTTAVSSFSASTVWSGIQQIIEGLNAWDLVGQPISVSFLFYTNVTGTFSVALVCNGGTYSNVQTFSATAGTLTLVQMSFTASSLLTIPQSNQPGLYLGIAMLGGTTGLTSTYNAWVNANNNHAASNTNWAATVGNFISATNIKVEKGTVWTPYEEDDYQLLLSRCQRYYQPILMSGLTGLTYTSNGDTRCTIPLHVPMRVAPTTTCSEAALNVVGFGLSGYFTNVSMPLAGYANSADAVRIANLTTTNVSSAGTSVYWSTSDGVTFYNTAEF